MSENKKNSALTYAEIYTQSDSFSAVYAALGEITATIEKAFAQPFDELIFTGCGTSFYLAQSAAHAFSSYNATPARAVPCSELFFFPETFVANRRVLVLPITRKSYTTEVRMAVDKVRSLPNVKTLAITCDSDSAAYNDYMLLSPDTHEESVIMTRSFTSMVYLSMILAMTVAGKKSEIAAMKDYGAFSDRLLPQMDALSKKIITEHPHLNLYIMLGQGVYYGIANECMNKIKEMGIANSEAYYSLEYRHGPMSLVDKNTLIVMLANPATTEQDGKLLTQMKGLGAVTVAVGAQAGGAMSDADYSLALAEGFHSFQYAAAIGFIGQFLGYYIAQQKNIDADSPRNLSQAIVLPA